MATRKAKQHGVEVPSLNGLMRELAREAGFLHCGNEREPGEFTMKEFCHENNIGRRTAGDLLDRLMKMGKVTRRQFKAEGERHRLWLYKKV